MITKIYLEFVIIVLCCYLCLVVVIIPLQNWNQEGLQTVRNLARNMSFMIKAFADAKDKYGLPKEELDYFTSFPDGK